MRLAVTVAGEVNKQGPVAGTGAATEKVASLVTGPNVLHTAPDATTDRTEDPPRRPTAGDQLRFKSVTRFYVNGVV